MAGDSGARYVDPESFERYMRNGGTEFVISRLVNLPAAQAFDAWLQDVWVAPGKELSPGTGRGLVGHVRGMALGVEEEIIAAGEPPANGDAIASVTYRLRKYGALALSDHIAQVRFIPDATSPDSTLVVWSVKSTPSKGGNVLFCGGSLLRAVFRTALGHFMNGYVSKYKKKST